MATTKIWPVHDSLKRLVEYAGNPEKTEFKDLSDAINYAGNESKTEKFFFVSGINCSPDKAYQQMTSVKKHFGKLHGNVAYHGYQSFFPGEITPEECHEIGRKLATFLWGDRYQILVATHLDKEHLHNHFLLNSVSFIDGKKFNDNKKAYYQMRKESDRLCAEYGLSVIKNPKGKTPRSIYFAEKSGEPTKFNLMREAIDKAIENSVNISEFKKVLLSLGYELNNDPRRKYATIKKFRSQKATRLYHLGEAYNIDAVYQRIRQKVRTVGPSPFYLYRQSIMFSQKRVARAKVKKRPKRKIGGLRGLYYHYCYLLGYLPKGTKRRPLSPDMKEAWRRIERTSEQIRLLSRYGFNDLASVEKFIVSADDKIAALTKERSKVYNRLRRCTDPDTISRLKKERDSYTESLRILRKEIRTGRGILEDTPKIKEEISKEMQMKVLQQQALNKNERKRDYIL